MSFTSNQIRKLQRDLKASDIREGFGTGEVQGGTLGEAHEKAIKTAETDATKRALATFGKPFGLSLYLGAKRQRDLKPDIERRRTLQKLGADGRNYTPPWTPPQLDPALTPAQTLNTAGMMSDVAPTSAAPSPHNDNAPGVAAASSKPPQAAPAADRDTSIAPSLDAPLAQPSLRSDEAFQADYPSHRPAAAAARC